jgi:inosine-uridine nucleoside N-ribohydrolase
MFIVLLFCFSLETSQILKHGEDGFSAIASNFPEYVPREHLQPMVEQSKSNAEDVILSILSREPINTVTILAIGPCELLFRQSVRG